MLNRRNKKGVTLIEVLIALVILLIVFMGLIQASLLSIDTNASNILRDEAVRLASDTAAALKNSPFDDLNRDGATDASPPPDPFITLSSTGTAAQQLNATRLGINTRRTVRNILSANYVITVTVLELDPPPGANNNKQVTLLVEWDWKERTFAGGNPNRHQVVGLLRRS